MNDKAKYLGRLEAYIRRTIERAENKEGPTIEYASFEFLALLFDAASEGVPPEDLAQALPMSWRENTVEVPLAVIGPIVLGWHKYREGETGRTMGECFKLEGSGPGKKPVVQTMSTRRRGQRFSNEVLAILATAKKTGAVMTQDSAFFEVARKEGVEPETVRAAFKKYSRLGRAALKDDGLEV